MSSINVSFMKRVTTGPYEHEEMSVQFSVDDRSSLESTTMGYRDFVYRTLGKTVTTPIQSVTVKAATPQTLTSQGEENGQSNKSSKEDGKKSSSKKSSKSSSEEVVKASDSPEEMEEVPSPYTDTPPAKPSQETVKETKKSSKSKDDFIVYDSAKDEHKSTLTNHLTKLTGGKDWAKDKVRSRKISQEILHGQPFMSKEGKILPNFDALCKKEYGVVSDVL